LGGEGKRGFKKEKQEKEEKTNAQFPDGH
jgi:hypothetical protein